MATPELQPQLTPAKGAGPLLISFGFTIAQVFQKHKSDVMKIYAQSSYPLCCRC